MNGRRSKTEGVGPGGSGVLLLVNEVEHSQSSRMLAMVPCQQ